MAGVKCVNCRFAEWERTPTGKIRKKIAGRCRAQYPDLPVFLSMPDLMLPGKNGIWPDLEGRCDGFKPLDIDAG